MTTEFVVSQTIVSLQTRMRKQAQAMVSSSGLDSNYELEQLLEELYSYAQQLLAGRMKGMSFEH